MERESKKLEQIKVGVLETCFDFSDNSGDIKNHIMSLSNAWNMILEEKKGGVNEYFGIRISSGDSTLGVVVKRDDLYLQGIFDATVGGDTADAIICRKSIRYVDCGEDDHAYICEKFIADAVNRGCKVLKENSESQYKYLHSLHFSKIIFAISEAVRFESIRLALIIGIPMVSCSDDEKCAVANAKGLFNVCKDMVTKNLLDYRNYDDLKKTYGAIISYGKNSKSKKLETIAQNGYANICMTQMCLGEKYQNKKHQNPQEIATYQLLGLIKYEQ